MITVSFQFLAPENPQNNARVLFYMLIVLVIVLLLRSCWSLSSSRRPSRWSGRAGRRRGRRAVLDGREVVEGGRLGDAIGGWVVIPQGHPDFGNVAYVALVAVLR